jgi:hypothetical protein
MMLKLTSDNPSDQTIDGASNLLADRPMDGSARLRHLNHSHHAELCFRGRVDVPLGGSQVGVTSQLLTCFMEPPTVDIFRAAFMMKLRRPL